jgi:hypothetical protein
MWKRGSLNHRGRDIDFVVPKSRRLEASRELEMAFNTKSTKVLEETDSDGRRIAATGHQTTIILFGLWPGGVR